MPWPFVSASLCMGLTGGEVPDGVALHLDVEVVHRFRAPSADILSACASVDAVGPWVPQAVGPDLVPASESLTKGFEAGIKKLRSGSIGKSFPFTSM